MYPPLLPQVVLHADVIGYMYRGRTWMDLQVPKRAGRLLHCLVVLDLSVGPSAIPCEIPVVTGYLMRICEIS